MREKGILIVVSGFSGSGKGTIMKELLKQYDNYALSISATTRNPRPGEEDGREYFFKTVEDFEKIEVDMSKEKPRVGIVGEVLIKYHPFGNNYVADLLEKEGLHIEAKRTGAERIYVAKYEEPIDDYDE